MPFMAVRLPVPSDTCSKTHHVGVARIEQITLNEVLIDKGIVLGMLNSPHGGMA